MSDRIVSVYRAHHDALAQGRSAIAAFEAASAAYRKVDPALDRLAVDRLVLGLLRNAPGQSVPGGAFDCRVRG